MRILMTCWILLACSACHPEQRRASISNAENGADVRAAIADTLRKAREAVDEHGVTPAAMRRMETLLARLAEREDLIEHADLETLHGDSQMGAEILASEGHLGISLYLVRFAGGTLTPVHDHLTWGVLHVLEGRDRYVAWERLDEGSDPKKALLRISAERVLGPGDSAHWFGPPKDIHAQAAANRPVWELVMTGEDVLHEHVTQNRHYFDPDTGNVTNGTPGESTASEVGPANSQGSGSLH